MSQLTGFVAKAIFGSRAHEMTCVLSNDDNLNCVVAAGRSIAATCFSNDTYLLLCIQSYKLQSWIAHESLCVCRWGHSYHCLSGHPNPALGRFQFYPCGAGGVNRHDIDSYSCQQPTYEETLSYILVWWQALISGLPAPWKSPCTGIYEQQ